MPKIVKFSSLHDDLQIPMIAHEHGVGEYKNAKFEQFNFTEKSVLERISQFGIDLVQLRDSGIDLKCITREQYRELMEHAIQAKYDVIFGSVVDKFIMSGFGDPTSETERLCDVMRMADEYRHWGLQIVQCGSDIAKSRTNLVVALEGADFVTELADLDKLMAKGIICFGLQYNKDNRLSTKSDGLTELGRQAVRKLLLADKLVDLAHTTRLARGNILDIAEDLGCGQQVAYTHGSTTDDAAEEYRAIMECNERLLDEGEARRIVRLGGIIGIGISKPFFDSTQAVAERIDKICQLENGVQSVALGSDLGGIFDEQSCGISSVGDLNRLADALAGQFHLPEETITRILRHNVRDWLQRTIKPLCFIPDGKLWD